MKPLSKKDLKTLSEEDIRSFVGILKNNFINIYNILSRVNREEAAQFLQKNTYFHEKYEKEHPDHDDDSDSDDDDDHDHGPTGIIFIPKENRTTNEQLLYELTEGWKLRIDLPNLLDYLSVKFYNIKEKGKDEWNQDAEDYVLRELMKEGVNTYLYQKLVKGLKHKGKNHSTDMVFIANPSQFLEKNNGFEFEVFDSDQVVKLIKPALIDRFEVYEMDTFVQGGIDEADKLKKEMFFLERDGRFQRASKQLMETNEKFMWVNLTDITEKDFPG